MSSIHKLAIFERAFSIVLVSATFQGFKKMKDGAGKKAQNWQRIRESFCFLPLQMSCFDQIGRLPNYLYPAANEQSPKHNSNNIG